MRRPNRSAWPRWARLLSSPWVVLPVVVVAMLLGAFLGYGAYTRSKPTHYERGGDQFAQTAPSAGQPTASTSATPSPGPSASVAGTSATPGPGSSVSSGGADGDRSSTSSHPKNLRGVVLPAVGSYGLAVSGSEHVKFGPFTACNNSFPASAMLVVSQAQQETATSFNFDLRLYTDHPNRHDERHIYRYTTGALYLDYEKATVTCGGVKQSSTVDYTPPQQRARLPLAVGQTWSGTGGDSDRTETETATVLGTSQVAVEGRAYRVYIIETRVRMSGSESGTRVQRWWYAPSLGLPLKWYEEENASRSGATYQAKYTVQVTRLP